MKYTLALILSLLALPVYANPIFEEYIDWITANSDFEYNGEDLPTLEKMSKDWLEVYAYGPDAVAQAENNRSELPEIIAVFDHEKNQIIVDNQFDLNDFTKHHILVHELVHFLQLVGGHYDTPEAQRCQTSLEPIAYELHTKWMDEVDHPAERPNQLFLFLIEQACHQGHPVTRQR